jgi:signal transduction histidine kinase/ActR/RegA family two-component response regulator
MLDIENNTTPAASPWRTNETLLLLADARKLLDNCTCYQAMVAQIANLLVSRLASWCSIDLLSPEKKIVRVAVTHRDPNKADLAKEMLLHHPASPTAKRGVYRVIETGKSILIPDMPESDWAQRADTPRHLQLLMELGSTSYMCVPLIARGKVVGSIMLLSGERVFDEYDLQTAEELARSIAMAMDNVNMFRTMQEAVRVRDEFLATLSHEIRTPLNVILGWINILKTEKLDDNGLRQALDVLDRNTQLQARLINDLLDLSRIMSGKLLLNLKPVDLEKLLQSSSESLELTAKQKGLSLKLELQTTNATVSGDSSHLQRMIFNLLTNAIKFTPAGGTVEVELKNHADNQSAQIYIRDNGVGIEPGFIPHVFEAFRQENGSTTRVHEGLGLGLAITKHIVEAHGGHISVSSHGKGKGSEFMVKMPTIEVPAEQIPAPTLSSTTAPTLILKDIQVLLVDDCDDIRNLITRYLEKRGAIVLAASSAFQALELLKTSEPDILLSDISMPEMDGYDLISCVRKLPVDQGGKITAVALTAFAREEEEQKSLSAGFDLHLSKPITALDLVDNIVKLLKLDSDFAQ